MANMFNFCRQRRSWMWLSSLLVLLACIGIKPLDSLSVVSAPTMVVAVSPCGQTITHSSSSSCSRLGSTWWLSEDSSTTPLLLVAFSLVSAASFVQLYDRLLIERLFKPPK
jgi:hypothetical protein